MFNIFSPSASGNEMGQTGQNCFSDSIPSPNIRHNIFWSLQNLSIILDFGGGLTMNSRVFGFEVT